MEAVNLGILQQIQKSFSKSTLMESLFCAKKSLRRIKKSGKIIYSWTDEEWSIKEEEADADIKAGRVAGPFKTMQQLIASLKQKPRQ
jgi:hypothetical protein